MSRRLRTSISAALGESRFQTSWRPLVERPAALNRSASRRRRCLLVFHTSVLAMTLGLSACRKSPTLKQIKKYADKVCACKDAACAEAVQAEYLDWWKGNMRARGSEGDRKGVEKTMQRYAECHLKLVGPESAAAPTVPVVPKVDLEAAAPHELASEPAIPAAGAAKPAASSADPAEMVKPEAQAEPAPSPGKATQRPD